MQQTERFSMGSRRRIASIGSVYPLPHFGPLPPLRSVGQNVKWEVSQALGQWKEREQVKKKKPNRARPIQLKFYVSEMERDFIVQKMKLIPTRNMGAYLRKMAIDGYVIQIDHTAIKEMTAEIRKIGVNVNQIARRVNATGTVYEQDLAEIKGVLEKIWHIQRSTLLNQR